MEPTDHMGLLDPMNNMEDQANQDPAARPAARRTILAGAGIAAGATLLPQVADAADASYVAAHHHGAPLLSTRARHLVGRFAYGVTPALARRFSTTEARVTGSSGS